ncbi:MAG: multifunctional CCA addition/repair protein [Pseudomonadales bacterium]
MQTFLVGGAVRDTLLDLPVHDRDWVVVGGSPEKMLALGYQQVGRDFPVFLHPDTKEEYALARIERKVGSGYTGFECDASSGVTLEEDLQRRDLTINAIAQNEEGQFVDPYGGVDDLRNKVLRHVSPAFVEDPLRVLRVARFAARFAILGFTIAPQTLQLMSDMASQGELKDLVAERVWQELQRAMQSHRPDVFIQSLRDCRALEYVLPEVDDLFGVPQTEKYHPEVDTGIHTLMALQQAVLLDASLPARYAVLLHDLGKGQTPRNEWPRHIAHEQRSKLLADSVSQRLKVPADCADCARLVAQYHTHCHRALELNPKSLLKLIQSLDAMRRPERLHDFVIACEADARGRTGFEDREYPQAEYLRGALTVCQQVDISTLKEIGYSGVDMGEQIRLQRLRDLTAYVSSLKD